MGVSGNEIIFASVLLSPVNYVLVLEGFLAGQVHEMWVMLECGVAEFSGHSDLDNQPGTAK